MSHDHDHDHDHDGDPDRPREGVLTCGSDAEGDGCLPADEDPER